MLYKYSIRSNDMNKVKEKYSIGINEALKALPVFNIFLVLAYANILGERMYSTITFLSNKYYEIDNIKF